MTFQAAPVDRALGSVKRMWSSGHMVVFDDDGSYVLNKMIGEIELDERRKWELYHGLVVDVK